MSEQNHRLDESFPHGHAKSVRVGILAVTILNIRLNEGKPHGLIFRDKPNHANLSFGHQKHFIPVKFEDNAYMTDVCSFVVNASKETKTRILNVEVSDDRVLIGGGQLGNSGISVSDLIEKEKSEELKQPLMNNSQKIGALSLRVTFIPQTFSTLSFQFSNAMFLNREKQQNQTRQFFIRLQIGEDIQETPTSLQTLKQLPSWNGCILKFQVPYCCANANLEIFQKRQSQNILLADQNMELQYLRQDNIQRTFFGNVEDKNKKMLATLKFSSICGNKSFKDSFKLKDHKNNDQVQTGDQFTSSFEE